MFGFIEKKINTLLPLYLIGVFSIPFGLHVLNDTSVGPQRCIKSVTKCKAYRAVYITTLESAPLCHRDIKRLSLQFRHLRYILHISWKDNIPGTEFLPLETCKV